MLFTYLIIIMLKRTPLKPKKFYSLKKTPLKVKKVLLKKTELKKPENYKIKKQNDKAKEKWEKARQKCIEKYKGKCAICGKLGNQVHHIHLRSKRRDLLLNQNNLILLCDKHHFHRGSDKYKQQCEIIAMLRHISVEELLRQAEQEEE